MVTDNNTTESINTALILLQRRVDRLVQAMNKFTKELNACKTIEEVIKLKLTIDNTKGD